MYGEDEERDPEERDPEKLLRELAHGRELESGELLDAVYQELRGLADQYLARERADHTLQPTALVHEAYLRITNRQGGDKPEWADRNHFFATAARAMRNVLVDHARTKKRDKRGGGWKRVELDEGLAFAEGETVDLVVLDRLLNELAELSPRQAEIIELRFFGGLEVNAVAELLNVSEGTVARDWRFARAWLGRALEKESE